MGKRIEQGTLRGERRAKPREAAREAVPDRILPMLARPSDYPDDEQNYAFEVKWDGMRAIVYSQPGRMRIENRNLQDMTGQWPELSRLNRALHAHEAVLDGEIVAFDERGLPSFEALQARREGSRVYVAFDVLYYDGRDVTDLPYEERRALLESLDLSSPHVQISPSYVGHGRALLATPGLEGVVAKRLGSAYDRGARSSAWLKIKTQRRQEFVIGGWTRGKGARDGKIGALLLGVYDEPRGTRLKYAGSVGTGFSDALLDELERKMQSHVRRDSPFDAPIDKREAVFVAPRLVCEVEFTEWTRDHRLRHPSFKGLREDKDPHDVVREES